MTARSLAVAESSSWIREPATRTRSVRHDSGVWTLEEIARGRGAVEQHEGDNVEGVSHKRVTRGERVFEAYGPLVRRIAARTIRRLPRSLTMDDVVSAGWVGMAEALTRRPPHMTEEQFEACASYRVRGAILDYLRLLDPLSRRLRAFSRRTQSATRVLSQKFGRPPTQEELAGHLGMPLDQLEHLLLEVQEATAERCDPIVVDAPSHEPSPESAVSDRETWERLQQSVDALPERLRLVLTLHHQQKWSLRAIGEELGVTESRACQLHGEAVRRVRAHFEGRTVIKARRGHRAV